jgi:glycosyltransferase involved in cell wall biosynthesis
MRILHCIPNLAGGGAERQLCYLAAALRPRGHEVHVLCEVVGANADLLKESGCQIHALKPKHSYDLAAAAQLYSTAKRLQPNIIQTWLLQMDVIGGLAARALGIPHVLSERANSRAYPATLKTLVRISIGKRAAAIVANSGSGLEYWRRYNKSTLNTVIPNGIPPPETAARGGGAIGSAGPDIIFVGRYHDDKNLIQLTRAVATVLRGDTRIKAAFFGSGPLRSSLERLIASEGLQGRLQLGDYRTDIRDLMRSSRVFVSVGMNEGHPNAVLEAAIEGVPLVLSDIAPHRELFAHGEAIFVDPDDVAAIASGILDCLADETAASARAGQARELAMTFTINAMSTRYERLYEAVIDANGRA